MARVDGAGAEPALLQAHGDEPPMATTVRRLKSCPEVAGGETGSDSADPAAVGQKARADGEL